MKKPKFEVGDVIQFIDKKIQPSKKQIHLVGGTMYTYFYQNGDANPSYFLQHFEHIDQHHELVGGPRFHGKKTVRESIWANNKTLKVGDKVQYCGDKWGSLHGKKGTLQGRGSDFDGWYVVYENNTIWNLLTKDLTLMGYETPSVMSSDNELYCSCLPSKRELVTNNAGGETFRYCKTCKKEFKQNRSW